MYILIYTPSWERKPELITYLQQQISEQVF